MAIATGLAACAPALQPLSLYPENPHYFLFRDQTAVLITSGEHYGAVLNRDFAYLAYLDELHRHGLNLTRTFSGMYCEGWGEGWNTLNPAPGHSRPWARSVPGYSDGGTSSTSTAGTGISAACATSWPRPESGIAVELLFCVFYGRSSGVSARSMSEQRQQDRRQGP